MKFCPFKLCLRNIGLRLVLVSALVGIGGTARANFGGASGGGLFSTSDQQASAGKWNLLEGEHPTISIVREKLDVVLKPQWAEVTVTYVMRNTGPETKVQAVFPCMDRDYHGPQPGLGVRGQNKKESTSSAETAPRDLQDFRVELDGKPLRSRMVKTLPPVGHDYFILQEWWAGIEYKAPAHSEYQLKASYRFDYTPSGVYFEGRDSYSATQFRYIFSTGSNWNGPIGELEVSLDTSALPDLWKVKGAWAARNGKNWIRKRSNWEPGKDSDLVVDILPSCTRTKAWDKSYTCIGGDYNYGSEVWGDYGQFTATASSFLNDNGVLFEPEAVKYEVGTRQRCWAEGVAGPGIGEWLELAFAEKKRLRGIDLINGFNQSGLIPNRDYSQERVIQKFKENNRIKRLRVLADGKSIGVFDLADMFSPQRIFFPGPPVVAKTIRLEIAEVYPGSKFDDTCLGGVQVLEVMPRGYNPDEP